MSQEFTRGAATSVKDEGTGGGGRFVINLCNLDVPITVPQPQSARLSRYSFFLSHRWETDRRLYRLHMGYFNDAAEADKWLQMLRRVYPGAHLAPAPEAQPELMSDTQRLRILDVGAIGAEQSQHSAISEQPTLVRQPLAQKPAARPSPTTGPAPAATPTPASRPTPAAGTASAAGAYVKPGTTALPRSGNGATPTLEDTLNDLRTREFDMDPGDDLNATGVRHLRFEVEREKRAERRPGSRSRK